MQNPGIIKLQEIYESEQYVHIVLENAKGAVLSTLMKAKQRLKENETAQLFKCFMSVINSLHDMHIIHRDLNPENLLLWYYYRSKRLVI